MVFIFGWFIKRKDPAASPRVISADQLHTGDVLVGDLLAIVGGCPRFPGDKCDLVGGHQSVVCEYKGELYYKVIA